MVALLRFCFSIIEPKILILEDFLPLKGPLMATLNETRAFTSRNYVEKKGMNVPKLSKKHKLL